MKITIKAFNALHFYLSIPDEDWHHQTFKELAAERGYKDNTFSKDHRHNFRKFITSNFLALRNNVIVNTINNRQLLSPGTGPLSYEEEIRQAHEDVGHGAIRPTFDLVGLVGLSFY